MSVSAISNAVQLYPPVRLGAKDPSQLPISLQSQPLNPDEDQSTTLVKKLQDNQQQQIQQAQQVQSQNNNSVSVNLYV